MIAKKEIIVQLLVTKDMKNQLEELAKQSRRTVSDYLRLIIQDAITNQTKV